MLNSFFKIASFRINNSTRLIKTLPISLALSVTRKCNLKCKTCNIWQSGPEDELSLSEYIKIFASMRSSVPWLTFDGGEPFLRPDFSQIVINSYRYIKPKVITIATNCTLGDKIYSDIAEISESCPRAQIIINISIDGIGTGHDDIRGLTGVFGKVMENYKKIRSIRRRNLNIGINTTVSKFNIDKLADIAHYCNGLKPDSYLIELAEERDMFLNSGLNFSAPRASRLDAIDFILREIKKAKFTKFSIITQAVRKEYYKLIRKVLKENRGIFPCFAGAAFGHVFPNGDVWCCSVKNRIMGNLRNEKYNFAKVWNSPKADLLKKDILSCGCYCTSANANYLNMIVKPGALFLLGIKFLAWKADNLRKRFMHDGKSC